MALDSALKRKAVTGVGRPYLRAVQPTASTTGAYRSNIGLTYPVAAFAEPTAVQASETYFMNVDSTEYQMNVDSQVYFMEVDTKEYQM